MVHQIVAPRAVDRLEGHRPVAETTSFNGACRQPNGRAVARVGTDSRIDLLDNILPAFERLQEALSIKQQQPCDLNLFVVPPRTI